MLLHRLPEDILAIVLRQRLGTRIDTVDDFKRNLLLLAVCQKWRRLAIPMVYNCVIVQYGHQPDRRAGRSMRYLDAEPTDAAVRTNLDLVATVGRVHAVRRAQVDVRCLANPFPGWREVIQRMRAVASVWAVTELEFAIHPVDYRFDDSNIDMAKHTDDIAEVGDALVGLMPDVRRLECGGANPNPIAQSLSGRLASHYADQLRCLDSGYPMILPLGCQLTGLKRFHINYDLVPGYQLPQMTSGELVDMRLVNGPPDHSWASFSTNNDSWVIEFTNLKRLRVLYNADDEETGATARHGDGHPWELHFPSLTSLGICCSQGICPFLEYAVLPPCMESITIVMSSAAYKNIANVRLPETKRLSLRIDDGSRHDPSGLPVINRIVEGAHGSEMLELIVDDNTLDVVPETITCTTLTHLQVSATTTEDTMLAFIERMPNLIELTFFNLNLGDARGDVSVPDANVDAVVEPIHTSLRVLHMDYNTWEPASDMGVALMKYLLLRIPTLTEMIAGSTPNGPVTSFVEAYAPRYPHLSSVKLKLGRDEYFSHNGWGVAE
ncbi:hypothetical protein H4R21_000381 [Coemansia helicoidea]|uniref:Uncharacterized protein n=1 Tax=Coemansia helicoidea TaxID=1286919 RepID=A0ACC1LHD9_9FUNG|nr:hypothetical protein H4R21_000381 [Coemansia helicoidea]